MGPHSGHRSLEKPTDGSNSGAQNAGRQNTLLQPSKTKRNKAKAARNGAHGALVRQSPHENREMERSSGGSKSKSKQKADGSSGSESQSESHSRAIHSKAVTFALAHDVSKTAPRSGNDPPLSAPKDKGSDGIPGRERVQTPSVLSGGDGETLGSKPSRCTPNPKETSSDRCVTNTNASEHSKRLHRTKEPAGGRKRKAPEGDARDSPRESPKAKSSDSDSGRQKGSGTLGDKSLKSGHADDAEGGKVSKSKRKGAIDDIFSDLKRLKQAKANEEAQRVEAKKKAREEHKRRQINPFAGPMASDKRWAWADEVKPDVSGSNTSSGMVKSDLLRCARDRTDSRHRRRMGSDKRNAAGGVAQFMSTLYHGDPRPCDLEKFMAALDMNGDNSQVTLADIHSTMERLKEEEEREDLAPPRYDEDDEQYRSLWARKEESPHRML